MDGTPASPAPPPVLVATADSALQEVLADLLAEEGYAPYVASSLTDALALTDKRAYAMILAEVFTGSSPHAWDEARMLLRGAHPAPVALLITYSRVPEAIARAGFAFIQTMPFEIDELVARVASATARPLTPRQQRWAAIVHRYCAALAGADWNTLLELCTEDVVCYPSEGAHLTSRTKLHGRNAVQAHFAALVAGCSSVSYADLCFYPRSRGLTTRCTATWIGVDGHAYQAAMTLRLRFVGERISQIGVRVNHTWALTPARSCSA
jgi:CheY-like chemotaxis protein/ketosteroid isomerase-like protein